MPRRFDNKKIAISNQDGTNTELIASGNQHNAFFKTKNGYAAVKGKKGYEYAAEGADGALEPSGISVGDDAGLEKSGIPKNLREKNGEGRKKAAAAIKDWNPRWKQRAAESKESARLARTDGIGGTEGPSLAPPASATTGTRVGLCVIIQFPDVAGTITQGQVSNFCNLAGYSEFGNNGSVRDYFYDNSNGLLEYTNIVTAYYTAANNKSYYTDPLVAFGTRAKELATEALNWLVSEGFDFSSLSSDGLGYVYALNIFYAGGIDNNWSEGLWPHSWNLASPFSVPGGKLLYDYQITNMGTELTLFTFCHENAHMVCDFPDLYDYGNESNGCGNYCLMSAVGYDKNPPNVCAYLKHKAGWISVTFNTGSDTEIIYEGDLDTSYTYGHHVALNPTEYFIAEYRSNTGRDAILSNSGLAIWHVDESGSNDNEQMTSLLHYECSLEQADGNYDLENKINNGDTGDLFTAPMLFNPTTAPNSNWWDGTSAGSPSIDLRAGTSDFGDSTGKEGVAVLEWTIDQTAGIPANTSVRYRLYGRFAAAGYEVEVNSTGNPGATYLPTFEV